MLKPSRSKNCGTSPPAPLRTASFASNQLLPPICTAWVVELFACQGPSRPSPNKLDPRKSTPQFCFDFSLWNADMIRYADSETLEIVLLLSVCRTGWDTCILLKGGQWEQIPPTGMTPGLDLPQKHGANWTLHLLNAVNAKHDKHRMKSNHQGVGSHPQFPSTLDVQVSVNFIVKQAYYLSAFGS